MQTTLRRIVLASVWIAIAATSPAQSILHTSEEVVAHAQLVHLKENGQWAFDVHGKLMTVDNAALVRWGAWSGVLRKTAIWLTDGSWLAGQVEFSSPEEVTLHSDWFQPVKISLRSVRGIVSIAPASISAWNRLQAQFEATTGGRDTIWLSGNRQIAGVLRVEQDDFGKSQRYVLENAGQTISVDASEVQSIAFSPTLLGKLPVQSKQAVIGIEDGSRLNIRRFSQKGDRIQIELADRLELESLDSRAEFCRGITYLTNQSAATTFLSDIEPASYKHISQSQLTWPLGRNRDLYGQPLMNSLGIIDRGLATHSSSQVAYRLDASAQKFLAEVVLAKPADGADERLGSVACQVMVARSGKLQQVAAFNLDRHEVAPKALEVDIRGAQLLVLVTEQADFAQYGDHVLWLEARVASDKP
jgi:NPCBM/NEW2 domain